MVGLISIIIIIVISFVMMMEGWEKYDSQKFYTGLLVIGISIIMIFPVGNYIPVYTSLSIIITNSHKLIGIEFVRNKERR